MSASSLLSWELYVFGDAGFGTLVQNRCAESHVVVLGDVVERGRNNQMSRTVDGPSMR